MDGASFDQYSAYFPVLDEEDEIQDVAESSSSIVDENLPDLALSHTTSTLVRRHKSETTVGKGKLALRRSVRSQTTVKSDETVTPKETIKTSNTTTSEKTVTKPHVQFRQDEKPEASYDYEHLKITTSRGRSECRPMASAPGEVVLKSASNTHHPKVPLQNHTKTPSTSPTTSLSESEDYWLNRQVSRRIPVYGPRPTLAEIGYIPCEQGHVVSRRLRGVKRWVSKNILRKKPLPIPSPSLTRSIIE